MSKREWPEDLHVSQQHIPVHPWVKTMTSICGFRSNGFHATSGIDPTPEDKAADMAAANEIRRRWKAAPKLAAALRQVHDIHGYAETAEALKEAGEFDGWFCQHCGHLLNTRGQETCHLCNRKAQL